MPFLAKPGMRVRLTRGDRDSFSAPPADHSEWIAGRVPVGSVGTVREPPEGFTHYAVDWDGIAAKEGYYFAIAASPNYPTYAGDQLEPMESS